MTWRATVLAACVLACGCAHETEPRSPYGWVGQPPIALRAQETRRIELPDAAPAGPGASVPTARYVDPVAPGVGAAPPPAPSLPTRLSSASIPDGSACIAMLDGLGVKYERMEHERGIRTPVVVLGPIGGVAYHAFTKAQLVADCRLVVVLAWIAPILRDEGVTQARFSGAYSYRMSRVGRLSLHAYGLAIDVHELTVDGRRLTVQHNFTRGLGEACGPTVPSLDRIACRLKALGLFRELLTPDSNADHYNHFHFGILPTGMTLAMLPRAPKPKHAKQLAASKAQARDKHGAAPAPDEEQAGIQLIDDPEPEPRKHADPRHDDAKRTDHETAKRETAKRETAKRETAKRETAKREIAKHDSVKHVKHAKRTAKTTKARTKRRHRAEPAPRKKDAERARDSKHGRRRRAETTHAHRRRR